MTAFYIVYAVIALITALATFVIASKNNQMDIAEEVATWSLACVFIGAIWPVMAVALIIAVVGRWLAKND